ncbi:tubulin polymerization-promoting protein family member 2-like [Mercenaria mercenaria]|uniref:tubulin polymerization-promoting protein family member 2-like n=1 Tax=Mercenaria mercenaria TaxID=6596 RepID=UPI00234EF861|nr:tubulin polymerization-promoting protein family member 2-like [Mercenaria mercenaria]
MFAKHIQRLLCCLIFINGISFAVKDVYEEMIQKFKLFSDKEDGISSKSVKKMMEGCGILSKQRDSIDLDIVYSKLKGKKKENLPLNKGTVRALVLELGKAWAKYDKNSVDEEVKMIIEKIFDCNGPKTEKKKKMTTGTGNKKESFDEVGKGKEVKGRKYLPKNKGYAGQYKDKGSY